MRSGLFVFAIVLAGRTMVERERHSREFKLEAVRLLGARQKPIADLAHRAIKLDATSFQA